MKLVGELKKTVKSFTVAFLFLFILSYQSKHLTPVFFYLFFISQHLNTSSSEIGIKWAGDTKPLMQRPTLLNHHMGRPERHCCSLFMFLASFLVPFSDPLVSTFALRVKPAAATLTLRLPHNYCSFLNLPRSCCCGFLSLSAWQLSFWRSRGWR